jgi:hypothetical protein
MLRLSVEHPKYGYHRQNAEADIETYVNVNNHYEGCAPLTTERLQELL